MLPEAAHEYLTTPTTIPGLLLRLILGSFKSRTLTPILQEYFAQPLVMGEWYPLEGLLFMMKDVQNKQDGDLYLISAGLAFAKELNLPADTSLTAFFTDLDDLYKTFHIPVDGGCQVEVVEEGLINLTLTSPYPEGFVYGAVYGITRRLLPAKTPFTVENKEATPCKDGTSYEVRLCIHTRHAGQTQPETENLQQEMLAH